MVQNTNTKTVYCYDYFGFYTESVKAEPNQRMEGAFILPAYSTELEPPVCDDGLMPMFVSGQWVCELKPVIDKSAKSDVLPSTYREFRAAEYPPITDYLDGVVKNDQVQIQKYIDDCLEVKVKYPKP